MMMQRTLTGMGVTVAGLVGLLVVAQPVRAQQAPFPARALYYTAWLARAMDQCTPSGTTVLTMGSPTEGCIQTNSATDSDSVAPGATMTWARLAVSRTVNRQGRIRVMGRGFHAGQRIAIRLKLRVTKTGQQTLHPQGNGQRVTFEDFTVQCGNSPISGCFQAHVNGTLATAMKLTDCLDQNSEPLGLATGNIQILDSALVNCDTGKIFATPGIVN